METLFSGSKANIWKCDLFWERWFALGISCKFFVNVLNLKCDSSDLLRQGWFALGILTDESPLFLICIIEKIIKILNIRILICFLKKYINNCNRSLPIITFFQVLFQSIQNIDQLRPPYFQTQIMLFPKKLMVLGKLSILAVNLFFI